MFTYIIKRSLLVSIVGLFAIVGVAGCNAETNRPSEAEEEVGETAQALNCVAGCVQIYKACIKFDDPVYCAGDRDECIQECYENTCEPGEPDCCQGQPTCW